VTLVVSFLQGVSSEVKIIVCEEVSAKVVKISDSMRCGIIFEWR
jgi:hypothetical protein